jgi:hypothetical protein
MTEFPVDVLWAIKSMFIRSIWNPNTFKYTIDSLLDVYKSIINIIILWVIVWFIIKYIFKIIKTIKENKKNNDKLLKKQNLKEIFLKEKFTFNVLKYPIIWFILLWTSWLQVSLIFYLFQTNFWIQSDIIRENLSMQENWVLSVWSIYSLLIFVIAWYFIWLSFWNKMLRNIGILIYALWILFIILWFFLDSWRITSDLF